MRAVLLLLVAGSSVVACKIDLDSRPYKDAGATADARICMESMSVPSCLAAPDHSDFQWIQDNMLSTNCGGDDCHGETTNGQPPDGELLLAEGFAYQALLGKDPADTGPAPLVDSAFSPQHKLVVPGDPDASYLLFLLRGIEAAGDGIAPFTEPPSDIGYMPQGVGTLCCQKLDAVRRWIEAGALP